MPPKPKFDPNRPFEVASKPKFDPNRPFQAKAEAEVDSTDPKRPAGEEDERGVIARGFDRLFPGASRQIREDFSRIGRGEFGAIEQSKEELDRKIAGGEERAASIQRTAIETGLPVATAPLTGGLSLLPRIGIAAAAGGLGSLAAEPIDPSGSVGEAGQRAATSAAVAAGGEGVGSLVGKGLSAVAKGIFRPTAAGAEAAKFIEEGGGVLDVALQSESRTAKILTSLAETSVGGSKAVSETRGKAIEIAEKPIRDLVEGMQSGLSREEIGVVAKETIEGNVEAFKAKAADLYGEVDKVLGASAKQGSPVAGVSLRSLKARAESLLKEGLPSKSSGSILRDVLALPDEVSFRQASRIRSDLLSVTRDLTDPLANKATGQVKVLQGLIGEAIEGAAAGASVNRFGVREAKRLLKEANAFYREGAKTFNSKFIKQLAAKSPDVIVDAISSNLTPNGVRTLKRVVDTGTLEKIQGEYLAQLIEKSISAQGDIARGTFLSGQKLLTLLRGSGNRTRQAALSELLGPKLAQIQRSARILERTQMRTGAGLSGLNVRAGLEQGSLTIVALATTKAAAAKGLALTLTPYALGKLMTNPTSVRLLTRGFSLPAGSPEAARILAQLSAQAARLDDEEPEQAQAAGR